MLPAAHVKDTKRSFYCMSCELHGYDALHGKPWPAQDDIISLQLNDVQQTLLLVSLEKCAAGSIAEVSLVCPLTVLQQERMGVAAYKWS